MIQSEEGNTIPTPLYNSIEGVTGERLCEVCGDPRPSQNERFCSRQCMGKARTGKSVKLVCVVCGKHYTVSPSTYRRAENHYCSKQCQGTVQSGIQKGDDNPYWRGGPVEVICEICGGEFEVPRWRYENLNVKYCSVECLSMGELGEGNPNWRGGSSFEPYDSKFNKRVKATILERDDYGCQYCGSHEELCVHHIDYDKWNSTKANMITLCAVCHGKTNGRRWFWEAYFKMRVQEKESIQSRLHLITERDL